MNSRKVIIALKVAAPLRENRRHQRRDKQTRIKNRARWTTYILIYMEFSLSRWRRPHVCSHDSFCSLPGPRRQLSVGHLRPLLDKVVDYPPCTWIILSFSPPLVSLSWAEPTNSHIDLATTLSSPIFTMYLHTPLLLFLLTNIVSADANIFARSSDSFVRAASAAHQHAIKRSSGLARDLRLALSPILVAQDQASGAGRIFCISSAGLTSSNSTGGNSSTAASASFSAPSGTATATHSGSATSPAASASVAASPWKLTQAYVSTPSSYPVIN